ncbi:hypothetical protein ROM48_12460 [Cronobacter malonaticus]|uniref:hypothetical protein n=1 Tax=Cronobacter malonaticus TaxID=413503 RepID=UPI001319CFFF|nr:hypothetical protein [Cronobacter malonaticus]MDT3536822.1 hypothetical protein [Cronobacter malonaticus]
MATYKFYSIPFKKFTPATHGDANYLRMMSGGKVFFTHKKALSKRNSLNDFAEENEVIYLATHMLKDGSHWIHWLAKSKEDIILPDSTTHSLKRPFYCILALALIFIEYFTFKSGLDNNIFSVSGLCFFVFVFIFACTLGSAVYLADSLIIAFHPGNIKLKKVLHAVQQGDFSNFTLPETPKRIISQPSSLCITEPRQIQVEGLVKSPQIEKWQKTCGRGVQHYAGASFQCDSKPMIMCWPHRELNELRALFLKWHPPFITQDDMIITTCSSTIKINKHFRYIPREGHQVMALKNITDSSVYLPAKGFRIFPLGQFITQRRCVINVTKT